MNLAKILADNKVRILSWTENVNKISWKLNTMWTTDLKDIKGIGEDTISKLIDNGISSIEELKSTDIEKLKLIPINPISKNILTKYIKKCET